MLYITSGYVDLVLTFQLLKFLNILDIVQLGKTVVLFSTKNHSDAYAYESSKY